jgi:two-component system, OmpR family, sensor histidine kinase ArlS
LKLYLAQAIGSEVNVMRLRNKVFLFNGISMLLVFTILGAAVLYLVDDYNLYGTYQHLLKQNYYSQVYINQYLGSTEEEDITKALRLSKIYIEEALSRQAGSKVVIAPKDEQYLRADQKAALEGNRAYIIEKTRDGRSFYFSSPLKHKEDIIGTIQYQYHLDHADQMKRELLVVFIFAFGLTVAVILLLGYGFTYHLIGPIEKLGKSMRGFSKEGFSPVDNISTGDEVGELAACFNQMGEDIQSTIAKLIEEQQKQKRFLDSVTHEIRTPLTNMLGFTDLINRVDDPEDRQKYAGYIEQEGQRLVKMVDNLLELSQLRHYECKIEKKETHLTDLIERVIELMNNRINKNRFKVIKEFEDITLDLDEDKIKQVIINLIDNALKYSGGDTIYISLVKEEAIILTIEDNGIGIEEEFLKNIFEPFYRVDQSRSRRLGGAGLGLSICQEIIEKHGGKIEISSQKHKGTIVTICIYP